MAQRNGSACVSLNIKSENCSCSLRGQCCCVNGWKIAWQTADPGVVATGTESLMVQFVNCPAEGTGNVSMRKQEDTARNICAPTK